MVKTPFTLKLSLKAIGIPSNNDSGLSGKSDFVVVHKQRRKRYRKEEGSQMAIISYRKDTCVVIFGAKIGQLSRPRRTILNLGE